MKKLLLSSILAGFAFQALATNSTSSSTGTGSSEHHHHKKHEHKHGSKGSYDSSTGSETQKKSEDDKKGEQGS